mmetsp:Transcript_64534/g.138374  ORF Transcript_64534/g.138374 Transcript_64534/m.138374 type:complete len:183 (+) Transcript_64534:47-595(+)
MAGGVPWPAIAVAVVLAALALHFRLDVAQQVVQVFPGESEGLRALLWASMLMRLGSSGGTHGSCCYAPDWKRLEQMFCDRDLGVTPDAIPVLGHCTAYVRGRAEFPITSFRRGGYIGNLTQRRDGVYLVKEVSRDYEARSESTSAAIDAKSCSAIKACRKSSSSNKPHEKRCREFRRAIDDC